MAPHVELPSSWEEYLARLDKKNRHELRRKMRRLYAAPSVRDLRSGPQRWPPASRTSSAYTTRSRQGRVHEPPDGGLLPGQSVALADEGLIRLFMMDLDGRPAASVLCFDCCRQLHLYNTGFDPELSSLSVGLLSKVLCLEVAIEEGRGPGLPARQRALQVRPGGRRQPRRLPLPVRH